MALTHALSTNNYGTAHLIVSTSAANGTHTTLASAMADAVSGDTIFLRDSVSESVTLTAGVNIAAWTGGSLNTPTITGKLTMTTAGTCNISGIRLQTNSDFVLAVTGSAASIVNLNNCYLNCTNNTGISYTSSSGSSQIMLKDCRGDLGTTGIAFYSMSSAGNLIIDNSTFSNTGASTTASSNSAGFVYLRYCIFFSPGSVTATGLCTLQWTFIDTSAQNVTSFTFSGGASSTAFFCNFTSGTASAISITTVGLIITNSNISSSNTNAITGAGTILYQGLCFSSTSSTINTTTQSTAGTLQGGKNAVAPTAGMLGERIEATATSVAMVSNTPKTICSISLTPGIWDVNALAFTLPTGGTSTGTVFLVNISTTTNTVVGTLGVESFDFAAIATFTACSGVVPSYRISLAATTTYYLVANVVFTSTTCPTNGRLSATRVG